MTQMHCMSQFPCTHIPILAHIHRHTYAHIQVWHLTAVTHTRQLYRTSDSHTTYQTAVHISDGHTIYQTAVPYVRQLYYISDSFTIYQLYYTSESCTVCQTAIPYIRAPHHVSDSSTIWQISILYIKDDCWSPTRQQEPHLCNISFL